MFVTAVKVVIVIALGFLFAYLYGFIEHGFIPLDLLGWWISY
jgi:hypothetical protein